MALDPSIILGVKPPTIESPVNQLAQVLAIQGARNQNRLADLQFDTAQRGVEDQNRLRSILGITKPEDLETALYKGGFLDQGLKVGKDRRENAKLDAETGKMGSETVEKTLGNYKSMLPQLAGPQDAAQWLTAQYNDPVVGKILQSRGPLPQLIQGIPADAAGFRDWQFKASAGIDKFMEDQRGRIQITETGRHNKETERAGMITAGAAASNAATSRARLEHDKANDQVQYITTPEGIVAVPKKPAAGAAPQGQVVRDASGKPIGGAINAEAATRVRDANDVLSVVADARKVLPKAHGSYAGTAMGAAGQLVGVGGEKSSADAQLKVLAGALVSKMPKMSGPQSDKDVQLYREMAGQIGDSTLPIETRTAALNQVEALNRKYAGLPSAQESGGAITTGAPAAAAGGWSITPVAK